MLFFLCIPTTACPNRQRDVCEVFVWTVFLAYDQIKDCFPCLWPNQRYLSFYLPTAACPAENGYRLLKGEYFKLYTVTLSYGEAVVICLADFTHLYRFMSRTSDSPLVDNLRNQTSDKGTFISTSSFFLFSANFV